MCIRDSILRGMELIRSESLKSSHGLQAVLRNASFSKGWLHLAVQTIFAIIIVSSFILIIIMSIPKFPVLQPVPPRDPHCHPYATNCMVYCEKVPYLSKNTEDIVQAVSQLPDTCTEFQLTLHQPMFINQTLHQNWLPRLRIPIYELAIYDGNLIHFPPEAFLSQQAASIRTLVLCSLVIRTLTMNSFVGLSSLLQLYIKKSTINNVRKNVLQPVDDTLELLTITESQHWDPSKITGATTMERLTTVDFSKNNFNNILNRNSFTGLQKCKILYLNSCKISAIGAGAFDNLQSIEVLYLNDNFLVTIPTGLFDSILTLQNPKPRINLHDNMWYCSCFNDEINLLLSKDLLLIDPICVFPEAFKGKTFTDLQEYCINNTNFEMLNLREIIFPEAGDVSGIMYINNCCYNGNESLNNISVKILSPLNQHSCYSGQLFQTNISRFYARRENEIMSQNNWIKVTFFFRSGTQSMIQIGAEETSNYGLIWHQSSCPNEVYCVNILPAALRVYNIDVNARYVFCPLQLTSGAIETERCVFYNLATVESFDFEYKFDLLLYICTSVICLVMGAILVYALVRNNPKLLKGSKRILFVKHKSLDALVLPPKVPIRNDLKKQISCEFNQKQIFTLPGCPWGPENFDRNKSTRSSKSNSPSYISALQPTEDQLAEWRIKNHFNNDLTICSTDFFPYVELTDSEKTYESLK